MLLTITVCIGSGCHVKGSYQVIEALKELIEENGAEATVELEACFCQGRCTEGVVVRFGDELVTNVNIDNISRLFYEKVGGGGFDEEPGNN